MVARSDEDLDVVGSAGVLDRVEVALAGSGPDAEVPDVQDRLDAGGGNGLDAADSSAQVAVPVARERHLRHEPQR